MSALARRVELSPLTPAGMARRITSDLHPTRTESAFCYLVTVLADAAEHGLDPAEARRMLRGLADLARPDEYAELVRQTLAVVDGCVACGAEGDEELCMRCAAVTNP